LGPEQKTTGGGILLTLITNRYKYGGEEMKKNCLAYHVVPLRERSAGKFYVDPSCE
jgi:hypothetical protein